MGDNLLDDCGGNEYLKWIRNRIVNTYKETDKDIISRLDKIIYNYKLVPTTVKPSVIDKICSRYWNNFCNDDNQWMLEDIFEQGIVDTQKENIRLFVIGILAELLKDSDKLPEKEHKDDNDYLDMFSFM